MFAEDDIYSEPVAGVRLLSEGEIPELLSLG